MRWYRVLIPAMAGYGLGLAGAAALLSAVPANGGLVVHSAPVVLVVLFGTGWAGAAALAFVGIAARG